MRSAVKYKRRRKKKRSAQPQSNNYIKASHKCDQGKESLMQETTGQTLNPFCSNQL